MAEVRPWLPAGVVADRLPTATLSAALDRWAGDWFPGPVRLGAWRAETGSGEAMTLSTGPAGLDAVARAMIGPVPVPIAEIDRAKLDAAATACIDDLRTRLADLFDTAGVASAAHARHACAIDLPEAPGALHLSLSDALLAGWIRASLPAPPSAPALPPFREALDPQPVRLSALVGRCRLSLRELENWAAGDVLVLDRPLDAALDLMVAGRLHVDAPCRLVDAGDALHLLLL